MKILNNTHYFNENSKVYNIVADTNSFRYQSSRRMGYFQRMYFEYLYTKKVNGTCFFYTFTYNDKHIPRFFYIDYNTHEEVRHHCFDYSHIRLITNGSLSKTLYRKYGSRLRYFCACESGDGKGERGLGNNPHYHFIFYIQPIHKDNKPFLDAEYDEKGKLLHDAYKPIDCFNFRKLVSELWLGSSGFVDYKKSARFGIVQPGNFMGQVMNADAFSYVGKYVIKTSEERQFESYLAYHYYQEINRYGFTSSVLIDYFKYLTEYLNISLSFQDFVYSLELPEFRKYKNKYPNANYFNFFMATRRFDLVKTLEGLKDWFDNHYVPWYVAQNVNYYKRMHSGKPRMSKSLGEYGLEFISDIDSNPRITIPIHNKYKIQYPCLFYIRRLYYDVQICPVTGNVIYTLSELGKILKVNQLYRSINNYIFNIQQNIAYVCKNNVPLVRSDEFKPIYDDEVVGFDLYNDLKPKILFECKPVETPILNKNLSVLMKLPDYSRILQSFAVYKCVYEFRHIKKGFMPAVDDNLNMEDVKRDYLYFISQDKLSFDFSFSNVYRLVTDFSYKYSGFKVIQPFSRYIEWFELLDLINDTCDLIHSESKKKSFEDRSEHQRKLKALQYTPVVPFGASGF